MHKELKIILEIIKITSQSKKGIIALALLLISFIAYTFFKNEPKSIKIPVFIGLSVIFIVGILLLLDELVITKGKKEVFKFKGRNNWREDLPHRNEVFDKNIKGKVFSIELLEDSINIERKNKSFELLIKRDNVSKAIYNNEGKRQLANSIFENNIEAVKFAKELDLNIHNFLLGKKKAKSFTVELDNFPLRWASGGVFPVVHFENRLWTPFYCRDIQPFGWNIPLGASESETDISNPRAIIWREFIEEFLVLNNQPDNSKKNKIRRPGLSDMDFDFGIRRAEYLMDKHINLRKKYDDLDLEIDDEDIINFKIDTKAKNSVIISSNERKHEIKNILFAINPFEQGIEIVSVVHFELDSGNYILDGEIIEPIGEENELVRMPVSMISHDYLRKVFGKDQDIFKYYEDLNINDSKSFVLNSVERPQIPERDIITFDWDIKRRKAILKSGNGVGSEIQRYRNWEKNFQSFYNDNPDISRYKPGKFTPTSAKIASYYFALNGEESKS